MLPWEWRALHQALRQLLRHRPRRRCNGRRLTAIIYLNPDWQPGDGGELRLFRPYAPHDQPPLADVRPLMDRCVPLAG